MTRTRTSLALVAAIGLTPALASAQDPFYTPPGELVPGSGDGRVDEKVYEPGMRFPIKEGPAYPNSQVWGVGGYKGPAGSQCDDKNYSYPWHDNYCETRSWDMPLCPAGQGHQGQDIRASTCEKGVHWTSAAGAGTVTNIPESPDEYATYIAGANGTRYDYLHGTATPLKLGQSVKRGDDVDKVSNAFGNTSTSIHCHFNLKQDVGGYGFVYVPPYTSLIESYKELMGLGGEPPAGAFEQASCDALIGWAQDPDVPEDSVTAVLYFDGLPSDPDNIGVAITADIHRDDLCGQLGSCAHGFAVEMPRSLRDNLEHAIYVFAEDDSNGPAVQIDASPQSFTCAPPPIPAGYRRWIRDPETLAAWSLSPFWDMAKIDDAALADIPVGDDLGQAPALIRADDGSPEVWLVDHELRRHVPTPEIAARWGLDLGAVETKSVAEVQAIDEGPPLRAEPFMVKGSGPWIYLIDDPLCGPNDDDDPACAAPSGTTGGDSDGGSDGSTGGDDSGSDGGASGDSGASDSSSGDSGSDGNASGSALPDGYGEEDDGCGCTADSRGDGGLIALAGLLLVARRRRYR